MADNKLTIYNTVQLAIEIEAIKKHERALLTKVERQQYIEREIKSELNLLNTKLEKT